MNLLVIFWIFTANLKIFMSDIFTSDIFHELVEINFNEVFKFIQYILIGDNDK